MKADTKIHYIFSALFLIVLLVLIFSLYKLNTIERKNISLEKELQNIQNIYTSVPEIVKQISPSVVSILITVNSNQQVAQQTLGAGTGFIVSQDGYIITNKHIIIDTQANYNAILQNGGNFPAKVLYLDNESDLAILKIDGDGFVFAPIGNSDELETGEEVLVIGNALGQYTNSVSTGIVSGLNRNLSAKNQLTGAIENLSGVIQTDAAINLGNSGGPLINSKGKVVGVNVATISGMNNISFSIPINKVRAIIEKIKNAPLQPQSLQSLLKAIKN
jgi:S1-C subfamily serine protease